MAAPPYLMTMVFPWNSRMYGSASRRVPTSPRCSGGVFGIDRHVLVAQVGEEALGLVAVAGQADLVLDLAAGYPPAEVGGVELQRAAARAHAHPFDRDVDG